MIPNLIRLSDFRCPFIYVDMNARFYTFIRDFNQWKRESNQKISLRPTRSSTFEASLLQIRDFITSKSLIFPTNSMIRSQLTSFSKADIIHPSKFFAIRALGMVIGAFVDKNNRSNTPPGATSIPSLSSWY
jgi:hypothetical protein